jgi:hypothetical protein
MLEETPQGCSFLPLPPTARTASPEAGCSRVESSLGVRRWGMPRTAHQTNPPTVSSRLDVDFRRSQVVAQAGRAGRTPARGLDSGLKRLPCLHRRVSLASRTSIDSYLKRAGNCKNDGQRQAIQRRRSQHSGLGEARRQLEDCRVSDNASGASEPVKFRLGLAATLILFSAESFDRLSDWRRRSPGADDRCF